MYIYKYIYVDYALFRIFVLYCLAFLKMTNIKEIFKGRGYKKCTKGKAKNYR